jgi:hypothetical protein
MIVASGITFHPPLGRWMEENDAIKHLGITAEVMAVYKNCSCPSNIHLEHGRKVVAPMPYGRFQFVFISPEGTKALFGDITLRNWSRMCDYFSNNVTQSDDADNVLFCGLFKQYTGLQATPTNIAAAFEAGLMKASAQLQKVAPRGRGRRPKNITNNNNNNKQPAQQQQAEEQQQQADEKEANDEQANEKQSDADELDDLLNLLPSGQHSLKE